MNGHITPWMRWIYTAAGRIWIGQKKELSHQGDRIISLGDIKKLNTYACPYLLLPTYTWTTPSRKVKAQFYQETENWPKWTLGRPWGWGVTAQAWGTLKTIWVKKWFRSKGKNKVAAGGSDAWKIRDVASQLVLLWGVHLVSFLL